MAETPRSSEKFSAVRRACSPLALVCTREILRAALARGLSITGSVKAQAVMPRTRRKLAIEWPGRNRLLSSLAESERQLLAPYLCRVPLGANQYLYRQGHPIDRVYFPESGLVSLVVTMTDGRSVEVGLVGNEGATGAGICNGSIPCDVLVQVAGVALALRPNDLPRNGAAERVLTEVLGRYTRELLSQTMQIAACNRLHSIRQRAARWILVFADRLGSPQLPLTHELLATMIGVRRASVSEVAKCLQCSGLIEYRHGALRIRDRCHLERVACECYRTLTAAYS